MPGSAPTGTSYSTWRVALDAVFPGHENAELDLIAGTRFAAAKR